MAFSATVRSQINLGGSNGGRMFLGEWTGNAGDSAGTFSLAGNIPLVVLFQKFDPLDNTFQIIPRIGCSYSNGFTTLTIENQDNVSVGRFMIIESGN